MAINFPTSLDDSTSIVTVTDDVDNVLATHQNLKRDAIVAVETKIGYGADIPTVGKFFVGNTTAGTSQWRVLATTDIPDVSATYLAKTLYDANTILYATTDNTPVALTVGEQTLVGRITGGAITALSTTQIRTLINVADGATANAKATGAELDTGTDDAKFITAKAINDSHNVPMVAPGTTGNVMKSNGTDWISDAPAASVSVTTKGDLQGFSTVPARLPVGTDGQILESRASETTGLKWVAPPSSDSLTLSIPATDLTAVGERISRNANENQAFGDVCFYNSDGQCQIADADAIATAKVKLMAIATISADADGVYLKSGVARNDAWNWTVGGDIYLSLTGTTGNTLTQTEPTGTDDCKVYIGYALSADAIMFEPSKDIIERT